MPPSRDTILETIHVFVNLIATHFLLTHRNPQIHSLEISLGGKTLTKTERARIQSDAVAFLEEWPFSSILVIIDSGTTKHDQILYWSTISGYDYGDWISKVCGI